MFTKSLSNLTLTSADAKDLFLNIHSFGAIPDSSFLATLRALLGKRFSNGNSINLCTFYFDEQLNIENGDTEIIKKITNGFDHDEIYVISFCGSNDFNNKAIEIIKRGFSKVNNDFSELEDVTAFAKKITGVDICFYINEKNKSTAIFAPKVTLPLWHFIQSFIPRYIPWYFEENPITSEEKELLRSLTLKTAKTYEELIEKVAEEYDFRGIKIKKFIGDFEKRTKKERLSKTKDSIYNCEYRLDSIRNQYTAIIEELAQLRERESGLTWQINNCNDDSELMDYLLQNKHIDVINANNGSIEIAVRTTISEYDPDLYETMEKNKESYLYTGYKVKEDVFVPIEARKKLIDACFGDDAIMGIKVRAYYNLHLDGYVSTLRAYNFVGHQYKDYLTNPHFYFFACLGTYEGLINDALSNGDYIYAIEQCVLSAKTLNLAEGYQTVAPFLQQVFDSKDAIILMPDGSSCTPVEAYNWLVNQESVNQEAN